MLGDVDDAQIDDFSDGPPVLHVTGGPECATVAPSGRRRGLDDERTTTTVNAIPVLAFASGAISFTIENVTDIARTRNGEVLKAIITLAHDCGYVRSPPRDDNEVEYFNAGHHGGAVTIKWTQNVAHPRHC